VPRPGTWSGLFFSATLRPWTADSFDWLIGGPILGQPIGKADRNDFSSGLLKKLWPCLLSDRVPASALTDGGCDREFAWVEESFPAIDVSAEDILQLHNLIETPDYPGSTSVTCDCESPRAPFMMNGARLLYPTMKLPSAGSH